MKSWLRWLCVALSPAVVLLVIFAVARMVMRMTTVRCPAGNLVAGICVAPWHTTVMDVLLYGSVLLAAIGCVVAPAMLAPKAERVVAVLGFSLVAAVVAFAYRWSGWPELLYPLIVAIATGAGGVAWMWRRTTR